MVIFPVAWCQKRVAKLWTEFPALDGYAMGTNGKECKNPNRSLVAATFEKANTYVFAGLLIMNPTL
jgi:dihydroxyacid dehydratase/phosphogluconate dehydratase